MRYQMSLGNFQGQQEMVPGADWITFEPATFQLEPGATQAVTVELSVPVGASPGDYAALLQANIVSEGEGVQVGGAAATRLSFTVRPSTLLEAWLNRLREFLDDHWLKVLVVAGVGGGAGLTWWARRSFVFRFERR